MFSQKSPLIVIGSAIAGAVFLLISLKSGKFRDKDLLFLLVIVVVPGIMALAFYLDYKRKKDLEQLALSSGLAFDPDAAALPYLENTGISLFARGRSRKAKNLIIASGGGAAKTCFFDYTYITGSGKHRTTHNFTLGFFEYDRPIFPRFELRPENLIDKLGEMIGFKDIDIPGFQQFSDKYKLTGEDANAVIGYFGPQIVSFFEQATGWWWVSAAGQYLIVFRSERAMPLNNYQMFMEDAKVLASTLSRK